MLFERIGKTCLKFLFGYCIDIIKKLNHGNLGATNLCHLRETLNGGQEHLPLLMFKGMYVCSQSIKICKKKELESLCPKMMLFYFMNGKCVPKHLFA